MMLAGTIAALAAAAFSVPLVLERGWPIVVIGVVSIFFSYGYTGGPMPLAYVGLGEVFVMLFFGFVAVMGTVFVQTGEWRWEGMVLGAQIGALSTALIAINNLRDIEEDTRSNKRTLAVRFGVKAARWMVAGWCWLPYLPYLLVKSRSEGAWSAIPLLAAYLAWEVSRGIMKTAPSARYNGFLALSAFHLLAWTALYTLGCFNR